MNSFKKPNNLFFLVFIVLVIACNNDDNSVPIQNNTDSDNDTIVDAVDNCPEVANPNQEDVDNDGIGDACDPIDNSTINPLYPCENGMAGTFPCNGIDLMAHLPLETFGTGIEGSDAWGWTDSTTGKEYALMGVTNATTFVDITDTENPIYLGKLPTATNSSIWRDVKVYQDYAFIVSEAANHGMQVFDLTRLRDVANPPEIFTTDAHYTEFGSCHNIVINETSGFAYAVGTNTYGGGPHVINIQNPTNPVAAGGYPGYSHDAQVVTYNGPDTDYAGSEIFIGSNEDEVVILDVSDKSNPVEIATLTYQNVGYTHQGWFTEDMQYFIFGDETDELYFGGNTRTIVLDLNDLDNPSIHMEYTGTTPAIDHNGYVNGNLYYLANYTAGVRVIDISGINNQSMSEIRSFDTYPENNNVNFNGAWNVYPYFASGNILISDINRGLLIVRPSE